MKSLDALRRTGVSVVHWPGDVAVVLLVGEHDVATTREVRSALTLALEQGANVVVDLSEAEFIDSSVIHVLFESNRRGRGHGRRVSLHVPEEAPVRRALEITGVLDLLPAYGTRAEAIEASRQLRS